MCVKTKITEVTSMIRRAIYKFHKYAFQTMIKVLNIDQVQYVKLTFIEQGREPLLS
jgi:hypothetical protein